MFDSLLNKKTGVALGSGGTKGFAHIAVLEFLDDMGIEIDMVAGSSIGAVIGALYCAGTMEKFKKDLLSMGRRDYYKLFDPVFPRSGLIAGKKFINFLASYFPKNCKIEDFDRQLFITSTDYKNGKSVVFQHGLLLEALRASISIPGIFTPVRYKNTYLIDGAVANALPVNVLKRNKAGRTVAVNLHPVLSNMPMRYLLQEQFNRWNATINAEELDVLAEDSPSAKDVCGICETPDATEDELLGIDSGDNSKRLPNIFETIYQSFDILAYQNTMLVLKYYKPTVLIEPELTGAGTLDFSDFQSVLTGGFQACLKRNRN